MRKPNDVRLVVSDIPDEATRDSLMMLFTTMEVHRETLQKITREQEIAEAEVKLARARFFKAVQEVHPEFMKQPAWEAYIDKETDKLVVDAIYTQEDVRASQRLGRAALREADQRVSSGQATIGDITGSHSDLFGGDEGEDNGKGPKPDPENPKNKPN